MNVKEMAQAEDTVRAGAIKRRMQQKKSMPPNDQNKQTVDDRKNMGY